MSLQILLGTLRICAQEEASDTALSVWVWVVLGALTQKRKLTGDRELGLQL